MESASIESTYEDLRHQLTLKIQNEGIKDKRVLWAINQVPRHQFVLPAFVSAAYTDCPLPIGYDQTISQPTVVAMMMEAAKIQPSDVVLDIGTGCGYAVAICSKLCTEVYTMETIQELAETARERLERLGYTNVHCIHADGSAGLPEHAPYDAIICAATAPTVPASLKEQLKVGGRLVLPVKNDVQDDALLRITRRSNDVYDKEFLTDVKFNPLIGKEGFEN